jgi:hypothetical protein
MSNLIKGLANFVKLTGNQVIAGIKSFSSFPVTPSDAPSSDYQAANKKYVDDIVGAAVTTIIGTGIVGDMPTGMTASKTTLTKGNQSEEQIGEYFYLVMGKDSNGALQMISGSAATGTQIPLPANCAAEDCHWFVSIKYVEMASDYAWSGYSIEITANRTVNIYTKGNNWVA